MQDYQLTTDCSPYVNGDFSFPFVLLNLHSKDHNEVDYDFDSFNECVGEDYRQECLSC